ncbi:matrixin family metalloprotease [bacterium]|nr:matrixin family metalloprotease [bacterium]
MSNEEKNTVEYDEEKENRGSKITLIVIIILLVLILGVWFWLKLLMPDYMFGQGKKYFELGRYDKALHMFELVANAKPYENEPIYYQALTLSKMPPTYETQKKLYDISQLEDCDEASQLAEDVLENMRGQLVQQVGPNYADNILFSDQLIRWNNSHPITYSISGNGVPIEYIDTVKAAFQDWQTTTNGEISFSETNGNANINLIFVDSIDGQASYDPSKVAQTEPIVDNDILRNMKISIRKTNSNGDPMNWDQLYTVALHQIGHALGLGGHSADEADVMFHRGDRAYDEDSYRKGITDRDLNTLRLLYRMVPDVIDMPIQESEYPNLIYHEVITAYPGENFEREIQRLLGELQHDRTNIVNWVDLAINYAYKKQYARSNYILDNIIPLVATDLPNQQVVLYNLAANYYKLREYDQSSSHLAMAEHIKTDFDTQLLDSFLDVRHGRLDLARTKLIELNRVYPDNIDIILKLAEIYHIKKDVQNERKVIDDFVKKYPKAAKDRRIKKYQGKKTSVLSVKDAI